MYCNQNNNHQIMRKHSMALTRRKFLVSSTLAAASASLHTHFLPAGNGTPQSPDYGNWEWVRSQFTLSSEYIHFATFYLATHPAPVRDAIRRFTESMDANPILEVEHGLFGSLEENLQWRVGEAAARYTGGKPDEFALIPNTTTGLALIYNGLSLGNRDEILTTTHDHYVHHETIRLTAERTGASWRRIALYDHGTDVSVNRVLERVRNAIKSNTRVLGITWVHSSTGVKLPVRAIADIIAEVNRDRDFADRVVLIVDGVHGLGAVDEKVKDLGCDFFISGTHKWLFGPRGTGIIRATGENWSRIRPTIPTFSGEEPYAAWIENRNPGGSTKANWVTPGGFIAYEYQWAMTEAFRFHEQIGAQRIAARINELNGILKSGLSELQGITLYTPQDPALSAGLVCFDVKGLHPDEVVHRLLDRKIIASTTPYRNTHARLSAGMMNTTDEVNEVLRAVRALL
jgi:isopenicillin-N epimerase